MFRHFCEFLGCVVLRLRCAGVGVGSVRRRRKLLVGRSESIPNPVGAGFVAPQLHMHSWYL